MDNPLFKRKRFVGNRHRWVSEFKLEQGCHGQQQQAEDYAEQKMFHKISSSGLKNIATAWIRGRSSRQKQSTARKTRCK